MRKRGEKISRIWLWISIAGFLVFSLSFLMMGTYWPIEYLPGIAFWLGLITGITGQIVLEQGRKSFFRRYGADRRKYQKRRCGALCWFSNAPAKIADVMVPICLIGFILSTLLPHRELDLRYLFLALTVFSFCMHCILNGRNYLFANNKQKVQRVLEQEAIRNFKKERE